MAGFITLTGNNITVFINNQQIQVLTTLRATDDYGLEPVTEVGDGHVVEYVPTVARHAISISKFLMAKETAISAGIINQNMDSALQGNTFDIEIFSNTTGLLMRKYLNASNTSGDVSIQANRLIVIDANFVATDVTGTLSSTTT